MKTFLIILGILIIYLVMTFVTLILALYIDRVSLGAYNAYSDIEDNVIICFFWPIAIWFFIGYLLYLGVKKYAIALSETIYQIRHSEDDEDNNNN